MAEKSPGNKSIDELRAEIAGSRERVGARLARPAPRIGFPGEIPQIISRTNGFLDQRCSRCRCADRLGANAEEENLCGCKKQPQITEEAGRNWLCLGCVESRRWPGPAGDRRVCQKSADRFWRKIPPQNIRPVILGVLWDGLVLGFTRPAGLRNYFPGAPMIAKSPDLPVKSQVDAARG